MDVQGLILEEAEVTCATGDGWRSSSFSEFFSYYGALEKLIKYNRRHTNPKPDARDFLDSWWDARPTGYRVRVPSEGGGCIEGRLEYRSNTGKGTVKQPNVIFMEVDGQHQYVVRRPVYYDDFVRRRVADFWDFNISDAVYDGGEPPMYTAFHIPEIVAVRAFSHLAKDGYPAVIPPAKEFDENGQTFYLREWMREPFADAPLHIEAAMKHIVFMHATGVLSMHDRRKEHYYLLAQGGKAEVVNIDPDFLVWAPRRLYGNFEARDPEYYDPYSDPDEPLFEPPQVGADVDSKDVLAFRSAFESDERDFVEETLDPHTVHGRKSTELFFRLKTEYLGYQGSLEEDFCALVNEFMHQPW
ncbi:MAG: hypothetical protein ACOCWQ_04995 [Nanoarchaeota archaeon]